jgi:hypothetical protein
MLDQQAKKLNMVTSQQYRAGRCQPGGFWDALLLSYMCAEHTTQSLPACLCCCLVMYCCCICSYGYDKYGYDKTGYSKQGYDKYGYDKYGYDHKGYDKYGESL